MEAIQVVLSIPYVWEGRKASIAWIGGRRVDSGVIYRWESTGKILTYSLLQELPSGATTGNYLAVWNASVWSQEGENAAYPFVCQTGVQFGKANNWNATASFPQMLNVSDLKASLQVTCNVRSHRVFLEVSVYTSQDNVLEKTTQFLDPAETFNFSIDSRLLMTSSGLYSGYVLLEANWPVTAVLYMHSLSQRTAASTLLIPRHIVQSDGAVGSLYFLVSGNTDVPPGQVLAAMTLGGPAEVSVLFPRSSNVYQELSQRGITYSQVTKTKSKTFGQFGSLFLNVDINFDGAVVSSPDSLAVFMGGATDRNKVEQGDIILDQVLPVEFIDKEYFTFPSLVSDVSDFVKIVAVESNTKVEITGPGRQENLLLEKPGDTIKVPLSNKEFYYLAGSTGFYAFKLSKRNNNSPSCMTSLYSYELWRHQYDFAVTSQLDTYGINIVVIVNKNYAANLTMDNFNRAPSCSHIEGTNMSRCIYNLPANIHTYYHLYLRDYQERLGAYMVAFSSTSILCHALGVRDHVKSTFILDHQYLLSSFQENLPCDLPTPDSYISSTLTITTAISQANSSTTTTSSISYSSDPSTSSLDLTRPALVTKDLVVDVKETSAYKRTKSSAPDERVSSITIGFVGIIFIFVAFGVIVLGDLINFVKFVDKSHKQR